MSRFAILLLSIVLVPVNADAQSKVLADEVEQLLRIHESEGMWKLLTFSPSGMRATW